MNTPGKKLTINREAAIIGCGEYGYAILNSMKNLGFTLNVMDINPDSFQKLSDTDIKNGSIIPITGNGMSINDLSILSKDISIIVVMTGDDSINLFIGQLAKHLFRTAKIICKINNEKIMLLGKNQGILTFSTISLLNETILSVI
jgi:trk system potassium uptake protein TrkA